jgi:glyoxylase-like metal-dependent hydrolase (beta-lactamase superfamily II)
VHVERIAEGLWRWTAAHPDWRPEHVWWDREVNCVYYEAPGAVVLVDPLIPDEPHERDRFLRALDADVERLGRPVRIVVTVHWHRRSTDELLARYDGRAEVPEGVETIEVLHEWSERLVWIPEHGALYAGDTLMGGPLRLDPHAESAAPDLRERLLALPVRFVIPSHGDVVLTDARAALERALAC